MTRYKTVFYQPANADGDSFEQWTVAGGLDAADRATVRRHDMLTKYEAPAIAPETDAVLQAFMDERRAVLLDSFA